MKKIIYPIILVVIIAAVAWFIIQRGQEEPVDENNQNQTEVINEENETNTETENSNPEANQEKTTKNPDGSTTITIPPVADFKYDTKEQEALAKQLSTAIDAKDFSAFATALRAVYDKGWQNLDGFKALESKMYVYVTDTYFVKKNYSESLRLANIVFDKVFESWRFSYMKIVSLQNLGNIEFDKGNYAGADKYAFEILAIEFRPEGADLHARVNIAKAKLAKTAGNITEAKALLTDALRYELTAERKAEAEKLLAEL